MAILHTLTHSPYQIDHHALVRIVAKNDALLLVQDGIIAALAGSEHCQQLLTCTEHFYALENDLLARGIMPYCDPAITIIDYAQFVRLTERYSQQICW